MGDDEVTSPEDAPEGYKTTGEGADIGGDSETTSVDTRWRWTNDILAGILVTSLPLIVGLAGGGVIDLTRVPVEVRLAYLTAGGVASVWAFGPSALKAWKQARGGG